MAICIEEQVTLEEVQCAFRTWRLGSGSRRKRIPNELWAEALKLLGHYTMTNICRTLRLDRKTFKQRAETAGIPITKPSRKGAAKPLKKGTRLAVQTQAPAFTVTKLEDLTPAANATWFASIRRPDGCVMTINSTGDSGLSGVLYQFCRGGS